MKGPFTVGQAVKHYLEWFRVHRRAIATTEANIKAHILPKWKDIEVAELTAKQINAWHSALATKPARKRTKLGAAHAYREAPKDEDAKRSAQAGADLLTISKLLGHADTRITSRQYAHLCDETLANAVNRFLPNFGVSSADNVTSLKYKSIF